MSITWGENRIVLNSSRLGLLMNTVNRGYLLKRPAENPVFCNAEVLDVLYPPLSPV